MPKLYQFWLPKVVSVIVLGITSPRKSLFHENCGVGLELHH